MNSRLTGQRTVVFSMSLKQWAKSTKHAIFSSLRGLPWNEIDLNAWFSFSEAERENRHYSLFKQSNVYKFHERDTFDVNLIHSFRQLCDVLESEPSFYESDTSFWNSIAEFCQDDAEVQGKDVQGGDAKSNLLPEQCLFLLIGQSIFGVNGELFLLASRLYLLLCYLPSCHQHCFFPNLLIFRQILSPLNCSATSQGALEPQLEGSQLDDASMGVGALDERDVLKLSSQEIHGLVETLDYVLKMTRWDFFQSDPRREFLVLAVEQLVMAMLDKAHEEVNRLLICQCLLNFLRYVHSLRHKVVEEALCRLTRAEGKWSPDAQIYAELRSHGMFVRIFSQPFSVDIFLYFLSCILRPLTSALACCTPMDYLFCQSTGVSKRVVVSKDMALRLMKKLLIELPGVCDPEEFYVDEGEFEGQEKSMSEVVNGLPDENDDCVMGEENKHMTVGDECLGTGDLSFGIKRILIESCRDPVCACLARCCLLVPDRRECHDLVSSAIVSLLSGVNETGKGSREEIETQNKVSRVKCFMVDLALRFCHYVNSLMSGGKLASFRTAALDISKALVEYMIVYLMKEKIDLNCFSQLSMKEEDYFSKGQVCIHLCCDIIKHIAQRIGDPQGGTRARALEALASIVTTVTNHEEMMKDCVLLFNGGHSSDKIFHDANGCRDFYCLLLKSCFLNGTTVGCGESIHFSVMVYDRLKDERQVVRKAVAILMRSLGLFFFKFYFYGGVSLGELEHILELHGILDEDVVHCLCTDPSLQVRTKMISLLQDFLDAAPLTLTRLHRLWLSFVLPSVRDPEKTVVEKALEVMISTVVEGISQTPEEMFGQPFFWSAFSSSREEDSPKTLMLPWILLQSATLEHLDYLGRFFLLLPNRENFTWNETFLNRLQLLLKKGFAFKKQQHCSLSVNSYGCLMAVCHLVKDLVGPLKRFKVKSKHMTALCMTLLKCCMHLGDFLLNLPGHPYSCIEDALDDNVSQTFPLTFASRFLLEALDSMLEFLSEEDSKMLNSCNVVYKKLLFDCQLPLPLITPALKCFFVDRGCEGVEKSVHMKQSWFEDLAHHLEDQIGAFITSLGYEDGDPQRRGTAEPYRVSEIQMCRYLYTLGDVMLLSSYRSNASFIKKLQRLYMETGKVLGDMKSSGGLLNARDQDPNVTRKTQHLLRSQIVVLLGKICLVEKSLAKPLIDCLASSLCSTEVNGVVCNSLSVFSDFSVCYAFLTDHYLLNFSVHLASGGLCVAHKKNATSQYTLTSALIRKQCLCLLGALVAQDFIKCKGVLVFRLLSCLGDPDPVIRDLAQIITKQILMPRQANFIQNHLVEMICFMCSWPDHPLIKSVIPHASSCVRKGSNFCFLYHPQQRQYVYSFFLKLMTDKDRHELSRRLIHDFLGAFVDRVDEKSMIQRKRQWSFPASVDDPAGAALRDALRLLGCKQMKITFHRYKTALSRHASEDPELLDVSMDHEVEPVVGASALDASIKNAYETDLLKRNLAYQILPTLLSLKRVMEDARSPFLGDILQCFKALLFDYRDELSDMLFHDPILAKQLEFDFKRNIKDCQHDLLDLCLDEEEGEEKRTVLCDVHTTGGRRSLLLDATGSLSSAGPMTAHSVEPFHAARDHGTLEMTKSFGLVDDLGNTTQRGTPSCVLSGANFAPHVHPVDDSRVVHSLDVGRQKPKPVESTKVFPSPLPLDSLRSLTRSHHKKLLRGADRVKNQSGLAIQNKERSSGHQKETSIDLISQVHKEKIPRMDDTKSSQQDDQRTETSSHGQQLYRKESS